MQFVSLREFRAKTGDIRKTLMKDKDMILTANGKPFALVTLLDEEGMESGLMAVRRARARAALEKVHAASEAQGTSTMPLEKVNDIIRDVRRPGRRK